MAFWVIINKIGRNILCPRLLPDMGFPFFLRKFPMEVRGWCFVRSTVGWFGTLKLPQTLLLLRAGRELSSLIIDSTWSLKIRVMEMQRSHSTLSYSPVSNRPQPPFWLCVLAGLSETLSYLWCRNNFWVDGSTLLSWPTTKKNESTPTFWNPHRTWQWIGSYDNHTSRKQQKVEVSLPI